MLHGALAQHRGFSRESLNRLVVRFFSLRGFGTVTAAVLCRREQCDTLRSTGHAFFVTCPICQSAFSSLIGKYHVRGLLN